MHAVVILMRARGLPRTPRSVSTPGFTVLAACEHLGLDPGVVRAQLAGMRVNDHDQAVAA